MQKKLSIIWFRQDLRLSDNPAVAAAGIMGQTLPVYIFDDCAPHPFKMGSASKIGLHHALCKLDQALTGRLNLYTGAAEEVMASLLRRYPISHVFWNVCYEPWHLEQEQAIQKVCAQNQVKGEAFNGNYLWSPHQVLKDDGSYYKVFTAYKKKALTVPCRVEVPPPSGMNFLKDLEAIPNRFQDLDSEIKVEQPECTCVHEDCEILKFSKIQILKGEGYTTQPSDLKLLPNHPWHQPIEKVWEFGEAFAQEKLDFFIQHHLHGYHEGRNFPGKANTSKLSPHLHFGELSPAQILASIQHAGEAYGKTNDIEQFVSELIWREFSCYLLYHTQNLHTQNFNRKFDFFPWERNPDFFQAWKTGKTGYPLVDAGMRELWQTGSMHNRVRMVVASFLVKNLNIDWREGMAWFWDCLIDADLANNSASWQWVAGSGVDAAPYFRIFNPTTQGETFDREGDYTRHFVPELKKLPNTYLFKPWAAPSNVLTSAGITLGITYPWPMIDLALSRQRALERYNAL